MHVLEHDAFNRRMNTFFFSCHLWKMIVTGQFDATDKHVGQDEHRCSYSNE
jgi:hypothetical protein